MHDQSSIPNAQGLYDPGHEHDACGVGFVVNIKGARSHDIVLKALEVLDHLTHRGACGCDPHTGDGAGMLLQIPHEFLSRETRKLGFDLAGAAANTASGCCFLPLDDEQAQGRLRRRVRARCARGRTQRCSDGATLPHIPGACGDIARRGMPAFRQVFVGRGAGLADAASLERKLYVIRKRATQ